MTCALPAAEAPPRSHPGTWLFGAAAVLGVAAASIGLVTGGPTTGAVTAAVLAALVAVLPLLAHLRLVPFACPIRSLSWGAGVLLVGFGAWALVGLATGRPVAWDAALWPAWGAALLAALWRTRALVAAARTP